MRIIPVLLSRATPDAASLEDRPRAWLAMAGDRTGFAALQFAILVPLLMVVLVELVNVVGMVTAGPVAAGASSFAAPEATLRHRMMVTPQHAAVAETLADLRR